jgi:hypothetical protein
MSLFYRNWRGFAVAAAALAALPVLAQMPPREGSSFAIVGQAPAAQGVLTAKNNGTLVQLDARPVSAVALGESIPDELAAQFGAKPDHPFDMQRKLYGWPERPGLYCDLLRTRGLGLSTACLRDGDMDGKFEQGLRLDFNSGLGDILAITSANKVIGVRFNPKPVRLPRPIAYAPATAEVTGKLALRWRKGKTKAGFETAEMWISTPDNYTGTEGLSKDIVVFRRDRAPLDVELYGIKLRVLGFEEKTGAMRYQVLAVSDGAQVPLMFRGHRFHIMII